METVGAKRKHTKLDEEKRRILNEMISAGESLPVMARVVGVSAEAARQYVNRTGQHDNWRENRGSYKQRLKTARQNLANVLLARLYSMAEQEEGWEYVKAIEYDRDRNNSKLNIPIEKILAFYREYRIAQENRTPITMREMAIRSEIGTYGSSVQGLMNRARLEPLFGRLERYPKGKITAVKGTFDSDLTGPDIAYFSGVPFAVVYKHFKKIGGRKRKFPVKIIGRKSEDILTYRRASEVYEAQDLGFTPDETSYLLDLNPRLVVYAIENQREIGGKIIEVLDILHPEQRHEKPYIQK